MKSNLLRILRALALTVLAAPNLACKFFAGQKKAEIAKPDDAATPLPAA